MNNRIFKYPGYYNLGVGGEVGTRLIRFGIVDETNTKYLVQKRNCNEVVWIPKSLCQWNGKKSVDVSLWTVGKFRLHDKVVRSVFTPKYILRKSMRNE